jgi:hypothetical protein
MAGQTRINGNLIDTGTDPEDIVSISTGDARYPKLNGSNTLTGDLTVSGDTTISGGSITGTDVDVSGATFTVADDQISGDAINGGTATPTALNVDSGTLSVDSANNRVGVGTSSPDELLEVSAFTGAAIKITSTSTSTTDNQILGSIKFENNDNSGTPPHISAQIDAVATDKFGRGALAFSTGRTGDFAEAMRIFPSGDISFYEDTGTTPKFYWDATAERLGIGTSSPSSALEVSVAVDAPTNLEPTLLTLTSRQDSGAAIEFNNVVGGNSKISSKVDSTGGGTNETSLIFRADPVSVLP